MNFRKDHKPGDKAMISPIFHLPRWRSKKIIVKERSIARADVFYCVATDDPGDSVWVSSCDLRPIQ